MSMIAEFVQVSPDELTQLVDDPSSIGRLLHEPSSGSFGLLMSGAARERLERMAPEFLSNAMQGLDPRLQEEIAQRIGVVREALASEEGGKAIVRLMESRGLRDDAAPVSGRDTSPRRRLSLEKAWHGVHFLLRAKAGARLRMPWGAPFSAAGRSETTRATGRLGTSGTAEVAAIAAALAGEGLRSSFVLATSPSGYRPRHLPRRVDQVWTGLVGRRIPRLRDFFHDAAASGSAIVTCLV